MIFFTIIALVVIVMAEDGRGSNAWIVDLT
jgi:hypothetical protein